MKKLSPVARLLPLSMLLLAGCQSLPPAPDGVSRAAVTDTPVSAWSSGTRFVVHRSQSRLRLIVRAEGPMARLGHPHVIGGSVIEGEIMLAEPFRDSALRLTIAAGALAVDRPEWRAAEGFEGAVDAEAIEGTRRNMLSPALLDAEAHPEIRIESIAITGPRWQPDIRARVSLAGQTRALTVPVTLNIQDETLAAAGRFVIRQTDFGLTPYSTAGGALRVSDEVLVRFSIEASAVD